MTRIICIFLLLLALTINPTYAPEGNTGTSNDELESSKEQLDETENSEEDYEVINYTEQELETNFVSKDYQIDGSEENNYLVEGGNENAVNNLATKEHTARGTLVENTNVQGQPYDLQLLSEEDKAIKKPLELRQFISFETKSGKVFHLIIDHSKSTNNVQMLTEVGEQDLLNLIEENAEVALILNEDVSANDNKATVAVKETKPVTNVNETVQVQEGPDQVNHTNLIIIIAASIVAGGVGWYVKIYKPKRNMAYDEEVDEADYIDEDEYVEDEEIN